MPSPTAYPTYLLGGPLHRRLYQETPEFQTVKGPKFYDGAQDTFNPPGVSPVRRWAIDYEGLTETEAALLDDHYEAAEGMHLGFPFTDPRTGIAYTNVKYLDYDRPAHNRRTIQARRVRLEWRP